MITIVDFSDIEDFTNENFYHTDDSIIQGDFSSVFLLIFKDIV